MQRDGFSGLASGTEASGTECSSFVRLRWQGPARLNVPQGMRDESSIGTSHSTCSEAGTFDKVLAVRREVVRAVRVDARVERAKAEDAIPVAVGRAVGAPGSSAEEACVVPATTLRQLQSSDREETIMNAPKDRAMLVQSAASANKVRGRAVPRAGGCHVAAAHPILPARIHHDPERRRPPHPFHRIVVVVLEPCQA